jgi:hypothetical protein
MDQNFGVAIMGQQNSSLLLFADSQLAGVNIVSPEDGETYGLLAANGRVQAVLSLLNTRCTRVNLH